MNNCKIVTSCAVETSYCVNLEQEKCSKFEFVASISSLLLTLLNIFYEI